MDDYISKPKPVQAVQWDGKKGSAHIIVGTLLNLGHRAWIEDNYASQGPDLIVVETRDGEAKVYEKDYIVKEGPYLRVIPQTTFEDDYEKAPPPPKPPVMRGSRTDEVDVTR
jgi:hypothetical protein